MAFEVSVKPLIVVAPLIAPFPVIAMLGVERKLVMLEDEGKIIPLKMLLATEAIVPKLIPLVVFVPEFGTLPVKFKVRPLTVIPAPAVLLFVALMVFALPALVVV